MAAPVEEDVKAVLADFEDRLRRVVDDAWQKWLAFPDRGALLYVNRFRAIFVFDCIARGALAEFASDPNIHVIQKHQTVQFLFKDRVLVRFKKGNGKGVGSNIETQAVLDFVDPQGVIPGLVPEVMRVEVCYSPDAVGIRLNEVAVVARTRHRRVWAYGLAKSAGGAIVSLPTRSPDTTPPVVVPRQPLAGENDNDVGKE